MGRNRRNRSAPLDRSAPAMSTVNAAHSPSTPPRSSATSSSCNSSSECAKRGGWYSLRIFAATRRTVVGSWLSPGWSFNGHFTENVSPATALAHRVGSAIESVAYDLRADRRSIATPLRPKLRAALRHAPQQPGDRLHQHVDPTRGPPPPPAPAAAVRQQWH